MNELYFLGVNIIEETKSLMKLASVVCTDGMSESELKAYHLGVDNVLSALETVLANEDMIVANIDWLEIPTELSIDDLEEYYLH